MNQKKIISNLYSAIKQRPEVKALIPMGYVPNLPILTVREEQLMAIIPFLRYKTTGKVDQTMVFPIRYLIEYSLPEMNISSFKDLAFDNSFAGTEFNKAVGFFRHEAVKDFDNETYHEFRLETLAIYDKLCETLLTDDSEYGYIDDDALRNNIRTLVEPSLRGFYYKIDKDFYDKYIKD